MGEAEPEVHFFASPAELRDWFDANHETAAELWLGYHKKATGRPTVSWSEAVDEALCVGWIDSVRYSIDAERSRQRFTPRRKGSNWSSINIAKVAQLIAAFSPAEESAFRAAAAAWAWFEARPQSFRTHATWWVVSAKRDETRRRRFAELVAESAAGRAPKHLTPPGRNPDGSPSR
jgi:uncharacterized protein YdeI (YjbR/CyaY-like superfamily)